MKTMTKLKLTRKVNFCCGQQYSLPDDNPKNPKDRKNSQAAFGKLYSPHGWGHNYILEATIEGYPDKISGMVMNLRDLDAILKSVTDPLDHQFLNKDIEYFKTTIPTSENLALYLYQEIANLLKKQNTDVNLHSVRLFEGEDTVFEAIT